MAFYEANYEFIRLKEVYKGNPEWDKAFVLFHCLSMRDRYTAEHSIEVGYYAAKIAEQLELDVNRFFLAGLLHDIGKINMEDNPLKSDNILSEKERKQLKRHVLSGVLTLSELGFGKDIVQFCLRHHERMDGSGYPFGVKEENISIEGRIAQVADVFSALTNFRSYRSKHKIYTYEDAIELMRKDATVGIFDLRVISILEGIIDNKKIGLPDRNSRYA